MQEFHSDRIVRKISPSYLVKALGSSLLESIGKIGLAASQNVVAFLASFLAFIFLFCGFVCGLLLRFFGKFGWTEVRRAVQAFLTVLHGAEKFTP